MSPDRRPPAGARRERAVPLHVRWRCVAWLAWMAALLQLVAPVLGHAAAYAHAAPLGAVCTSAGAAQEGGPPTLQHGCQACVTCASGAGAMPPPAAPGTAHAPVAGSGSRRTPQAPVVRNPAHWPASQPRAPPAIA